MFYTIACLHNLSNSVQWWVDGTLKTAPKLFYQLFVIHAQVYDHVFPLIYCVTTKKNQSTYTTIFRQLVEHANAIGITLNQTRIVCDFEPGLINAITEVFPHVAIGGCLFHLTSAVYKYGVQKCGLKTLYREDEG